jgi:hypothetical protein
MIQLYKVEVEFPTIAPLVQRQTFLFDSKEEAQKFEDLIEKRTNYAYTGHIATYEPEIFDANMAFNWIVDEINNTKKAVGA